MEDVNKQRRNFISLCKLGYGRVTGLIFPILKLIKVREISDQYAFKVLEHSKRSPLKMQHEE